MWTFDYFYVIFIHKKFIFLKEKKYFIILLKKEKGISINPRFDLCLTYVESLYSVKNLKMKAIPAKFGFFLKVSDVIEN